MGYTGTWRLLFSLAENIQCFDGTKDDCDRPDENPGNCKYICVTWNAKFKSIFHDWPEGSLLHC